MYVEVPDCIADRILAIDCPYEPPEWTADGDKVNCTAGEIAACYDAETATEIAAAHNIDLRRKAVMNGPPLTS